MLRTGAIALVAGLLSASAIASKWVVIRTAENRARGHAPNMDPAVAVVLAQFLAAPALLAFALFECGRTFATGVPLNKLEAVLFGCLVGLPFGLLAFLAPWAGSDHLYFTVVAIVGFAYAVRSLWHRKQP